MSTVEQNEPVIKRWQARRLSQVNTALIVAAIVAVAMFILAHFHLFQRLELSFLTPVDVLGLIPLLEKYEHVWLFLAILLSLLAAAYTLLSIKRVPPPIWRVKQELIQALADLRYIKLDDREVVNRTVTFQGVPRWNNKAKCLTLRFDVKDARVTLDRLQKLENSLSAFNYAQELKVERFEKNGRIKGYTLTIWYAVNPYKNIESEEIWD